MSTRPHWVIVGAGSAGCVLANRLSGHDGVDVTLVEDGPGLWPDAVPPALSGPSFFAAMAEADRSYVDLHARRTATSGPSLYARGRGLGGSSAINAMVALRGAETLYNQWGWNDLAAFDEAVAFPMTAATENERGPVAKALMEADASTEAALLTRRDGKRVSAAEAYLWPAIERENLSILVDTPVYRILFDHGVATGIEFDDGTSMAADRVILAAGAVHSPVILLRSGVQTRGIGDGLQDHPAAHLVLALQSDSHDTDSLAVSAHLHRQHGGDLIQFLPLDHLGTDPTARGLGALFVALMTPTGKAGTVRVDANGDPVVNFALLEDPHDLQLLTQAVRQAITLLEHRAFAAIVNDVYIDSVGTRLDALDSDEAIRSWLRTNAADYVHATSTCAMGTVVDADGAVHGYEQLFVCDASVFPSIPDANTHLPTTLLAERLSQRILRR